jgi:uncharacterized membrane protein YeaQ/YmgE (transglycosylase-associated protein family)
MRRILQALFGLSMGVAVQLVLPGHRSMGLVRTIVLCLAGAIAGEFLSQQALPADIRQMGGFAASALGAVALLLVYGIVVQ